MLNFKKVYHALALICLLCGVISIWTEGNQETFKYSVICGMLIDIYAEVSD